MRYATIPRTKLIEIGINPKYRECYSTGYAITEKELQYSLAPGSTNDEKAENLGITLMDEKEWAAFVYDERHK